MPNMEMPYAETPAVAKYIIKTDRCPTGVPGSTNLGWQRQVHITARMLLFNLHEQTMYYFLST